MSARDLPEVRQTRGAAEKLSGRCGAKLRYSDPPRYCIRYPRHGRTHCKTHGGGGSWNADAKRVKNALGSRYAYLSPKVFESFDRALHDEQLMDLKPDIALLETLKEQAAKGLDAGESLEAWNAGKDALRELHGAKTKDAFKAALAKLDAAFETGPAAAAAREETGRAIERRAKVVRTHQQLMIDSEDLIPAKRVGLVMAMTAALVREFIRDDAEWNSRPAEQRRLEFSARFVGLLGPRLRPRGQPAGAAAGPVVSEQ